MIQYGDIRKLSGYDLEPVDLIVGGSPCQNFSIAGNRQGLEGSESGLFLEMIRIIKEMRKNTNGIYPRYVLLENVPGIFSSNGGFDFQSVLTEFIRILEPESPDVPCPQEGWPKAGIIFLPNGSLAWRTHDAQLWGRTIRDGNTGDVLFMGTPQRRRRVSVVVDLRGKSAPEILFELSRLPGNPPEESEERKGIAGDSSESLGSAMYWNGSQVINTLTAHNANGEKSPTLGAGIIGDVLCLNDQGGSVMDISEDKTMTLRSESHGHEPIVFDPSVHHGYKEYDGVSETVRARYGTGGNNVPMVIDNNDKVSYGVTAKGNGDAFISEEQHTTLSAGGGMAGQGYPCALTYALSSYESNAMKSSNPESGCYETETARTLDLNGGNPACNQGGIAIAMDVGFFDSHEECSSTLLQRMYKDPPIVKGANRIVRRLTPKECERLQGFPDDWTNIPGASDSKRYKALGNSICLPFWEWLARRFARYGNVRNIGSLFDGIGGFPLCFKRAGAETLWTSEIEPFCEQVVKYHHDKGEI
jgi:DNA (cytosine-5)-methyltransferase 1